MRPASILNWRKRFTVGASPAFDGATTRVGSERFGAAASASFMRRLVASAYGSYHAQLGTIDRAGAQLAWQPGADQAVLSAGVEDRLPWFDSSSIFNLFGARAYQGAYAVYQQPLDSLHTDVELRTWGRYYHGDDNAMGPSALDAGVHAADERALGGAVSHRSRLRVWHKPVVWRSLVSYQASLDRGTDQFLADTRVRVPVWQRDLFVSGRGLFLAALTDNARFDPGGVAATGVLGVDVPISTLGTLSAVVETTAGSFYPVNTSVYATFALEHWP